MTEKQGENVRTAAARSEMDKETASTGTPRVPNLGFIDGPSCTCYQPDPGQDTCDINWYYLSVNATATGPTAPGFLTLFAGDSSRPLASTINFSPGQTRANNAVVPLASDFSGKIKVTNGSGGSVHFLLDVNGYFQ